MHYTGPVYRPPPEANTPLLEVTYGCSWEKCSFCTMYHSQKFGISPLDDIKEDLEELSAYYPKDSKRIFLVNGDAFALQSKRLLEIADLIHQYFPDVDCISSYASIRNIKPKSSDELSRLRKAGYNELYIGLETAYEPALKQMRKGYTQKDEYEQLKKLQDAGIEYNALLMLGVAGIGKYKENAIATVELLNTFKPKIVGPLSTAVQKDSYLNELKQKGEFIEASEREMIEEELLYLENLKMDDDCFFFGSHPYNLIRFSDTFKNKNRMIENLRDKLNEIDEKYPGVLDSVLSRGSL